MSLANLLQLIKSGVYVCSCARNERRIRLGDTPKIFQSFARVSRYLTRFRDHVITRALQVCFDIFCCLDGSFQARGVVVGIAFEKYT